MTTIRKPIQYTFYSHKEKNVKADLTLQHDGWVLQDHYIIHEQTKIKKKLNKQRKGSQKIESNFYVALTIIWFQCTWRWAHLTKCLSGYICFKAKWYESVSIQKITIKCSFFGAPTDQYT